MIQVEKEPDEWYKHLRVYENCKLCNKQTNTWHRNTNTPICENCTETHNESELQ